MDECNSLPCQNGGQCVDKINGYDCLCEAGFTGQNCEIGNLILHNVFILSIGTLNALLVLNFKLKPHFTTR